MGVFMDNDRVRARNLAINMLEREERGEEAQLIAEAALKDWPLGGPHLLLPPSSPLQTKLFAVWHMMHEGLLPEENAIKALCAIVEELMPREEQLLRCSTCQRDYGLVRAHEGAELEAVCQGCVREGRTE